MPLKWFQRKRSKKIRPEWSSCAFLLRLAGHIDCRCGEWLETEGQVYEHWQRGCFDYVKMEEE